MDKRLLYKFNHCKYISTVKVDSLSKYSLKFKKYLKKKLLNMNAVSVRMSLREATEIKLITD